MIENEYTTQGRKEEILRLGKEGRTTLKQVADQWRCSTANIAEYLHRLQDQDNYAYLVDGKGFFRIFQEIQ